jgi:hypothetical protein
VPVEHLEAKFGMVIERHRARYPTPGHFPQLSGEISCFCLPLRKQSHGLFLFAAGSVPIELWMKGYRRQISR